MRGVTLARHVRTVRKGVASVCGGDRVRRGEVNEFSWMKLELSKKGEM